MTSPTAGEKVFIRCDAGGDHGLGHIIRCLTLADAFVDRSDHRPVFITENSDCVAAKVIANRGHRFLPGNGPAGSATDIKKSSEILANTDGDNLLIIDSKLIDADYPEKFRQTSYVACIDDEKFRDLKCDTLINNNIWATHDSYPQRKGRTLLLGPEYNLIRQSFFEVTRKNKGRSVLSRVLITMGGEDPLNHSHWFLENFLTEFSKCEVIVIVGPSHPAPDTIRNMSAKYPLLSVIEGSNDITRHMVGVDLAVSAGGTTCYELAAAQITTLALAIEPHQAAMIEKMEKAGCLVSLGSASDVSIQTVREQINKHLDAATNNTAAAYNFKSPFKAPGAPVIVDALWQSILNKTKSKVSPHINRGQAL
jgi:UDP-2,4-diacetamido-2,4,6-trideoxy-beta-L-altropyranose hydrolase